MRLDEIKVFASNKYSKDSREQVKGKIHTLRKEMHDSRSSSSGSHACNTQWCPI